MFSAVLTPCITDEMTAPDHMSPLAAFVGLLTEASAVHAPPRFMTELLSTFEKQSKNDVHFESDALPVVTSCVAGISKAPFSPPEIAPVRNMSLSARDHGRMLISVQLLSVWSVHLTEGGI